MDLKDFVTKIRQDYGQERSDEMEAIGDPFELFEKWLAQAVAENAAEPNAMVLSTATPDGKPSSRIVLLRGISVDGFTFFTNYDSRKASEIEQNPHAALLFFWAELEKQVRVEGVVAKAPAEVSDAYFASRPRESQIGAWVSPQSRVIDSRQSLEEKFAELAEKWKDEKIDRPPNWGGFVFAPTVFEFWQGRPSRLHDRLIYRKSDSSWLTERLAP